MKAKWIILSLVSLGHVAGDALAQQATSVQLPTFSFFSVATTVSVPDGGSTYMGGIGRSSEGRNEFGSPLLGKLPYLGRPFNNTGIGSQTSASSVRVTAQIHDFEAMDAFLLGQPGAALPLGAMQPHGAAALGMTLLPRTPAIGAIWSSPPAAESQLAAGLADAQARRSAQATARTDEARDFFERAQKAEAAGKSSVAKIYYQMAARRATGELKDQAVAKLEALSGARGSGQVAQTR
jgi:hypothetical protein